MSRRRVEQPRHEEQIRINSEKGFAQLADVLRSRPYRRVGHVDAEELQDLFFEVRWHCGALIAATAGDSGDRYAEGHVDHVPEWRSLSTQKHAYRSSVTPSR